MLMGQARVMPVMLEPNLLQVRPSAKFVLMASLLVLLPPPAACVPLATTAQTRPWLRWLLALPALSAPMEQVCVLIARMERSPPPDLLHVIFAQLVTTALMPRSVT